MIRWIAAMKICERELKRGREEEESERDGDGGDD